MIAGYFILGAIAGRLALKGIRPMAVAAVGMSIFILVQLLLIFRLDEISILLWLLFGFFGTACILPYAELSQCFPKHLIGRVNTGLNLLVFVAAFAGQWMIGVIINLWPQTTAGGYAAPGYSAGFGLLLLLQVFAALWFFYARRTVHGANSED